MGWYQRRVHGGSPAQICFNNRNSTMNSWILALLASLLYNYVSCNTDGQCADEGTGNPAEPAATCDSAAEKCKATLKQQAGEAIKFDPILFVSLNVQKQLDPRKLV